MLSMLHVGLTIKVKVGIPESFKVGWYPLKITGSSHLKDLPLLKFVIRFVYVREKHFSVLAGKICDVIAYRLFLGVVVLYCSRCSSGDQVRAVTLLIDDLWAG